MQQPYIAFSPGVIILDRYMIEDFLGEGGFSTVYLVHDLQTEDGPEKTLFALKELRNQMAQERARFVFEGKILERLSHRALPRIHRVFEDGEGRAFMLLEYIQGPNLEKLRQQQLERRFSLSEMLTIMEPVFDAVIYLHRQVPPILHRDIKPANIIVPGNGERAVLVDFGIAKEYDVDATTTAIRHCSPGYGAPEQYSGVGSDPRTDVYGLGATCYALLTGSTPIDAFHRATSLVSKRGDPLVALNERAPEVPIVIAHAIARALAIGQEQRFSDVEQFWQALHDEYVTDATPVILSPLPRSKRVLASLGKRNIYPLFLLALVAFLSFSGIGFGFWSHVHNGDSIQHVLGWSGQKSVKKVLPSATLSPSPVTIYATLAVDYRGTVYDVETGTPTNFSLTGLHQDRERVSGLFVGLHTAGSFAGVLDSAKHIFLTVPGTADHPPLFFQGTIKADGSIVGNYCNQDTNGQCTGGYGIWSLLPSPLS